MNNAISILDFPERIQKSFSNVEQLDTQEVEIKIVDNFNKDLITEDLFIDCLVILDKVKEKVVGTVIGNFKKMAKEKWVPINSSCSD